jgi:hypothetical protein
VILGQKDTCSFQLTLRLSMLDTWKHAWLCIANVHSNQKVW